MENSERDGNTRLPDLPLEKLVCRQEATVRTGHGTTDWFQIGKGGHQGCILSPCLFNFYAEYILRNAGLDKAQAGIKIAGRNINNLRYAHLFKNFPQFVVIHIVKGSSVVNKAKVNVLLEFSWFFDDPTDVGNLISGSSAFS